MRSGLAFRNGAHPMAFDCRVHTWIDAQPALVFATISNLDRLPETLPSITALERLPGSNGAPTHGPLRVGTRWRETRLMHGRQATEILEIVELVPGRSFTVGCTSNGCVYRSVMSVEPHDGGTLLRTSFSGQAVALSAKLLMPLSIFFRGAVRKGLQADVDTIKLAVERASTSPAADLSRGIRGP